MTTVNVTHFCVAGILGADCLSNAMTFASVHAPALFTVLLSRGQYTTCRIVLPDEPKPLAAIRLGERYYSFFRVVSQAAEALKLATKLCYTNNCIAIAKVAKGYSLWVEELDAFPYGFSKLMGNQPEPAFSRILVAPEQFQSCDLDVPDLDKSIPGIEFQQRYYSIFRKESSAEAVMQIVAQLAERNDESVLIANQGFWTICIAEPEAITALMMA